MSYSEYARNRRPSNAAKNGRTEFTPGGAGRGGGKPGYVVTPGGVQATGKNHRPGQQVSPTGQPLPGPGGPPGGPPAGGPPPGATLAGDPGLLGAEDARQKDYADADSTYAYTIGGLGASYGIDAAGGIDANNPYSRAALLQESFKRQRAGNTTSYASQGQLYSGALQNAQDESTRGFNIDFDRLSKSYAGDVFQAGQTQRGAYRDADNGVGTAALAALLATLRGGR